MLRIFKLLFLIITFVSPMLTQAQTRIGNIDGDWDTPSNWSGTNVPNQIVEHAVLTYDNDMSFATSSYTIGRLQMFDRSTLVMNSGDITIGSSSTTGDFLARYDNSLTIAAGATMTIWGDFDVKDRFDLKVDGELVVKGNLIVGYDVDVDVNGMLTVEGDMDTNDRFDLNVPGTASIQGSLLMGYDADVDVSGNLAIGTHVDMNDRTSMNISGTTSIAGNIRGNRDNAFTIDGFMNIGNNATFTERANASGTGGASVGGTCSIGGSGGSFCSFATASPLPIQLMSFSANEVGQGVEVIWSTASEENNSHFEVQRSFDGRDFETLAIVEGAGNSTQIQKYEYVDAINYKGLVYYRLKQIDYDGGNEVFRPVSIKIEAEHSQVKFFLGTENLFVQHNLGEVKDFHMEIYDMQGCHWASMEEWSSTSTYTTDRNMPEGLYIIKARVNQLLFSQKLLLKRD